MFLISFSMTTDEKNDKKRQYSSFASSSSADARTCYSFDSLEVISPSNHHQSSTAGEIRQQAIDRIKPTARPLKSSRRMIPESDIRAQYSHIFAHAYNNSDRDSLMNLLNTYCTDDVSCVYKFVGKQSPYGPMYTELVGKNVIIEYWELCFVAVPDLVFQLHETKIRVLPNSCCVIISKFTSTGTKAMALTNDQHTSVVYSENRKVKASDAQYRQSATRDKPENITVMKTLEQAQTLDLIGTVTYFVDREKKVNKIEFVHCVRS